VRRVSALLPSFVGGSLLVAATASRAEAQEYPPPSFSAPRGNENTWELAGVVSYLTPPIRGGTSPFGVGFGGRLGSTVGGLYLGAAVVDYLGQTDVDATTHAVLYGGELGYGIPLTDLGGAELTLRPQVGVGGLTIFFTEPNAAAAAARSSSTVQVKPNVDVVTTATARGAVSSSSGSGSSGGPTTSSSSSSSSSASATTTTTVSTVYLRPGVALVLSSRSTFAGLTADVLVIPGLTYAGSNPMTWISYGLGGQLGVRF
jgi:hypothetical protein